VLSRSSGRPSPRPPDAWRGSSLAVHPAQLCEVVRVHRHRTAAGGARRQTVFVGKLVEIAILAGQIVGDLVTSTLDLDRRDARKRAQLKAGVSHPVRRANERLAEIDRVFHYGDQRQIFTMENEVLDEGVLLAPRHAIAAKPALLEMSGGHLEHVALPLSRREALPRVLRVG